MPVWYMKEPLCALIFCGLDARNEHDAEGSSTPHGLKLAVMAVPSYFRQRRVKLAPIAKKVLQALSGGGQQTVAELADALVSDPAKRRKARDHVGGACNVLLSFLLVAKRGSIWRVTLAGQAWLKEEDSR